MSPTESTRNARAGFTIVELLVVVSIIALLLGILLPAVGKARDNTKVTVSKNNLRQLATAHATYASEWSDRQVTQTVDNFAQYGDSPEEANENFHALTGEWHPPIEAGRGAGGNLWAFWFNASALVCAIVPINFSSGGCEYWGHFRLPNLWPLSHYLSDGGEYHPVYFAPKDRAAWAMLDDTDCLNIPYQYTNCYNNSAGPGNFAIRSTYVFSPAALFSPDVLRNPEDGGFMDPWTPGFNASFRVPAMAQCRYSDLKTQFIEHAWLQNQRADCNPAFGGNAYYGGGTYDGCEPFYFNLGYESVPMTAFYDGHVQGLGTQEAMSASTRHEQQVGYGLWSEDTPWGTNGYMSDLGYDFLTNTSFHILTTDGILGRDTLWGGRTTRLSIRTAAANRASS